ncbi:MAG: hypothetical protein WC139_06805 [Candidatus Kapaibacterium sp.]
MIRKSVISIVIGLLVNLFIGQYSPVYSQYISKSDNHIPKSLKLSNLDKSKVLYDSTFKYKPLELEPITTDNIINEVILGAGLGGAVTFLTLVIGVPLFNIKIDPGGSGGSGGRSTALGGLVFLSLLISFQALATAGGVWTAGTNKKVGANFGFTLLGSLFGVGLEIGGIALANSVGSSSNGKTGNDTFAWIIAITSFLMPTAGAMVGLNITRYPKRVYEAPKSVLNLNSNGMSLSSPFIYTEQDKSIDKKPITFARLVTVSF